MTRKKKRSAKQLANDRRLGRMAKARAKKTKKKTARRSNPRAAHYNFVVVAMGAGGRLVYADGVGWASSTKDSAIWHAKARALNFAKRCGRKCVVATTKTSKDAIRSALKGKV